MNARDRAAKRPPVTVRRCTAAGCYCEGEDLVMQCRAHAGRMHCHNFADAVTQANLHAANANQRGDHHAAA